MLKVNNALVAAHDVTLKAGGRVILDHVNLAVRPGEIVTIIGPNGAGKSTLVKVLLGHEHIETTARYLRAVAVDPCVLKDVLETLLSEEGPS